MGADNTTKRQNEVRPMCSVVLSIVGAGALPIVTALVAARQASLERFEALAVEPYVIGYRPSGWVKSLDLAAPRPLPTLRFWGREKWEGGISSRGALTGFGDITQINGSPSPRAPPLVAAAPQIAIDTQTQGRKP